MITVVFVSYTNLFNNITLMLFEIGIQTTNMMHKQRKAITKQKAKLFFFYPQRIWCFHQQTNYSVFLGIINTLLLQITSISNFLHFSFHIFYSYYIILLF